MQSESGDALFLALGPSGGPPAGATETSAVYLWTPPPFCSSFGLTQVPFDSVGAKGDDAITLSLIRATNLDNAQATEDALYVWLQSEPEGGLGFFDQPIVKRATISEDPDNDPTLDGVTAIELRLRAVESPQPDTLLHEAEYRLCRDSVCDSFEPLVDHTAAADGDRMICPGLSASAYDPPLDGGELDGRYGRNAFLFAVPEPSAGLGHGFAIAALGFLARYQRRYRVHRTRSSS